MDNFKILNIILYNQNINISNVILMGSIGNGKKEVTSLSREKVDESIGKNGRNDVVYGFLPYENSNESLNKN